ncbi:CK1/TTBKL protein kinase [Aphelenchoides bicaudatus]|nr:CK1/TTBKL protein kinase [Aphelenchoides bicaudatus]
MQAFKSMQNFFKRCSKVSILHIRVLLQSCVSTCPPIMKNLCLLINRQKHHVRSIQQLTSRWPNQGAFQSIHDKKTRLRMCPKILKSETTLLQIDEIVRNRWHIKGLIGSGGYGQIYVASDLQTNDNVAIKAEPMKRRGKVVRRMILEQRILVRLQGHPHVPMILASGCEREINFIVMQLLSVNVGDLRKQGPLRRFSRSTSARIVQQTIAALRDLHNAGFLHRDIKAANLCFGITELSKHRLFVVDYGLVRCFKTPDGKIREQRLRAGFRGTLRYVSVSVHLRKEQGPSDDLVSLFYTFLELLRGELPWRHLQHQDQIKTAKEQLKVDDFQQISACFGEHLREFGRAVYSMRFDDEPNLCGTSRHHERLLRERSIECKEDNYEQVLAEEEINRHLKLIV